MVTVAEIGLPQGVALDQLAGVAFQRHLARAHHIGAVGEAPRSRWPEIDGLFDPEPGTAGRLYTTKGAFLRPISGLIGNLKYRWFDSDSRRREALQHERRDNRLEKVVGTTPAVEPAAQEKQAAPAP